MTGKGHTQGVAKEKAAQSHGVPSPRYALAPSRLRRMFAVMLASLIRRASVLVRRFQPFAVTALVALRPALDYSIWQCRCQAVACPFPPRFPPHAIPHQIGPLMRH